MKKLFSILLITFLLAGCTFGKATPTQEVEVFFSKYQTLDTVVISQLNNMVDADATLSATQKTNYKEAIKRQYRDLSYEVKDEKIDGNKATVTVEIEVYDLHKTLKTAEQYLADHSNLFTSGDGSFDNNKYLDYRISQMSKEKEKIKYTLNLSLTKSDKGWILDDLSSIDREKIHGLYNYS
jgi:uncharacterized protein YcfL